MKNNKYFMPAIVAIATIIIALFASCDPRMEYRKNYIQEYIKIDGTELSLRVIPRYENNPALIMIQYGTDPQHSEVYKVGSFEHDSLSIVNGDTEYNTYANLGADPFGADATDINITHIDVYSDKDFDANHKAGDLLNDILDIAYRSQKPFIDSGYERDLEVKNYYRKKLSDIKYGDLYLIPPMIDYKCNMGDLLFLKIPDVKEPHTFTVKAYATNGKVFTGTILIEDWSVFEKIS